MNFSLFSILFKAVVLLYLKEKFVPFISYSVVQHLEVARKKLCYAQVL
jgi:hypothetical protein